MYKNVAISTWSGLHNWAWSLYLVGVSYLFLRPKKSFCWNSNKADLISGNGGALGIGTCPSFFCKNNIILSNSTSNNDSNIINMTSSDFKFMVKYLQCKHIPCLCCDCDYNLKKFRLCVAAAVALMSCKDFRNFAWNKCCKRSRNKSHGVCVN